MIKFKVCITLSQLFDSATDFTKFKIDYTLLTQSLQNSVHLSIYGILNYNILFSYLDSIIPRLIINQFECSLETRKSIDFLELSEL